MSFSAWIQTVKKMTAAIIALMNRELRAKTPLRTEMESNRHLPAVLPHQLSMPESIEGAGVTIVFDQNLII